MNRWVRVAILASITALAAVCVVADSYRLIRALTVAPVRWYAALGWAVEVGIGLISLYLIVRLLERRD